jgi:hypothetical protein
MTDSENKKPSFVEGRRTHRLVAPHEATSAFAIHLARGQVGQGVDPCLDVGGTISENISFASPSKSLGYSIPTVWESMTAWRLTGDLKNVLLKKGNEAQQLKKE